MSKTNIGLVQFAHKALNEKWFYVYGTYGQTITQSILDTVFGRWTIYTPEYRQRTINGRPDVPGTAVGNRGADCSGLIKAYLWWANDNSNPQYSRNEDKSADGFFNSASVKGYMETMPDTPGILVHFRGHIGIYIGNGDVIESKGASWGVVKTKLSEGAWRNWSKCPFIDYVEEQSVKDKYKVNIQLSGHMTANDAVNRVNARTTVQPGEYFVFREVGNAINVSRSANAPGSWIDSRLNTASPQRLPNVVGDKYFLHVAVGGFRTANDALNRNRRVHTVYPGEYHIFRKVGNAYNITRTKGIAGSWIDDRANIGTASNIPVRPNNPYTEPTATLFQGAGISGNPVRWLQFELNWRYGNEIAIDGDHGPITQKWLNYFQRRIPELVNDGRCGPLTRNQLKTTKK